MKLKQTEAAWAAGFLDGEAHMGAYRGGGGAKLYLSITAAQVVRQPLDRLQRVLGGVVYGPYKGSSKSRPGGRPFFLWQARGAAARYAVALVTEHLSEPKLEQVDRARERIAQQGGR